LQRRPNKDPRCPGRAGRTPVAVRPAHDGCYRRRTTQRSSLAGRFQPRQCNTCCVNCANASCGERSRATKIRIDAANDLDDPTCEIGQSRGVIEAPLDGSLGGRVGCVRGYGSPYTTTRAPACCCLPKTCSKRPTNVAPPRSKGVTEAMLDFERQDQLIRSYLWPDCAPGTAIGGDPSF
jgi:hypothetical protein